MTLVRTTQHPAPRRLANRLTNRLTRRHGAIGAATAAVITALSLVHGSGDLHCGARPDGTWGAQAHIVVAVAQSRPVSLEVDVDWPPMVGGGVTARVRLNGAAAAAVASH